MGAIPGSGGPSLLPQPLRHTAVMRAGPLPRSTEAERPTPATSGGARGRLAIRSARGRWHPLPLRIDVAAPLRRRGLRRLRAKKLFEQVTGELRNCDAAPALRAC